jgi:tripartite-type tricarboxylate transporter receptor subunit TctC
MNRRTWLGVLLATPLLSAPAAGNAQAFPGKPVKIVVPFAAGGATDTFARLLAARLTPVWGQQVVVENKPGASGNIGAEAAARAPADGHTLLMATSNHAINATLYRKLSYSLTADLVPVVRVAQVPLVLVLHPSVPARSVAELVNLGKGKPRSLSYASGSAGTASHLAGEMFADAAGMEAVHVAYKGGAPAVNDLLAGHVPMMFANMPEVMPHIRAGKLLPLAVTSERRHPAIAATPTRAESGHADVEATSWFGLFAPKGTPPETVARIHRDVTALLAAADVKAQLMEQGAEPVAETPAEFARYVTAEVARWGAVVKRSGVSAD